MKLRTGQITVTAALLAICLISQLFKNTSVYITGPIINTCLILATLSAGPVAGCALSVITPVSAYFITGTPIVAAIPGVLPAIMLGNVVLVLSIYLCTKTKKTKAGLLLGMGIGSLVKALLMGLSISLILIPNYLPEAMQAKRVVLQTTFSVTQLITSLIGSAFAMLIWVPMKRLEIR